MALFRVGAARWRHVWMRAHRALRPLVRWWDLWLLAHYCSHSVKHSDFLLHPPYLLIVVDVFLHTCQLCIGLCFQLPNSSVLVSRQDGGIKFAV
jgi:hypothetical protein